MATDQGTGVTRTITHVTYHLHVNVICGEGTVLTVVTLLQQPYLDATKQYRHALHDYERAKETWVTVSNNIGKFLQTSQ